jgi:hypothetical protein
MNYLVCDGHTCDHEVNKDLQLGGGCWASSRNLLIYLDEVGYNVSVTPKEQWSNMEMLLVHRTQLALDSCESPRSILALEQKDLGDILLYVSVDEGRLRNTKGMHVMYTLSRHTDSQLLLKQLATLRDLGVEVHDVSVAIVTEHHSRIRDILCGRELHILTSILSGIRLPRSLMRIAQSLNPKISCVS